MRLVRPPLLAAGGTDVVIARVARPDGLVIGANVYVSSDGAGKIYQTAR